MSGWVSILNAREGGHKEAMKNGQMEAEAKGS